MLPWFVGPTPRVSNYPDTPHIQSGFPIRSTLSKVLLYLYSFLHYLIMYF